MRHFIASILLLSVGVVNLQMFLSLLAEGKVYIYESNLVILSAEIGICGLISLFAFWHLIKVARELHIC